MDINNVNSKSKSNLGKYGDQADLLVVFSFLHRVSLKAQANLKTGQKEDNHPFDILEQS